MTDEQTSVLDPRGTRPADDTKPAPAPEPADEPKLGWRGPVALLAVVSVITALVVWIFGGDDPATTEQSAAEATRPSATAPVTSDPAATTAAPTTAPADAGAGAPGAPAPAPGTAGTSAPAATTAPPAPGWETRTFQGVTFSVPPGSRLPDVVDEGGDGATPLFAWNGPALGGDMYAQVSMWVLPADGSTPPDVYRPVTVPGAQQAFVLIGPGGTQPETVTVDLHMMTGDRHVNLFAMFEAGPAGEQMAQDLIASVVVG
jgi:hypothetical protein